jgi:hypothetical protein
MLGYGRSSIEVVREKERPGKRRKTASISDPGGQKEPPSIKSYIFIAEKNIFSPERKEFSLLTGPGGGGGKKPLVRPQVILYGVTISDNYRVASIVSPGRPLKKGEREMISLKVGDPVGEYKIAKILSDRITLQAEEDSFDVLLYDASCQRKGWMLNKQGRNRHHDVTWRSSACSATCCGCGSAQPAVPREPAARSPNAGSITQT